jgi:hypothetical protein
VTYPGKFPKTPRRYPLVLCQAPVSTKDGDSTPLVVGSAYFDLSIFAAAYASSRKIYWRVVLATSSGGNPVYADLYDVAGITGSIGTVVGSQVTTSSLTSVLQTVDLTSALNSVSTPGLLQARLWVNPAGVGIFGTTMMAKLDVEW